MPSTRAKTIVAALALLNVVLLVAFTRTERARGRPAPPGAAEEALAGTVPEFVADGQPLEKVLDRVRAGAGCKLVVRWEAIVASQYGSPDTPVTLKLRNVRWSAVLSAALRSACNAEDAFAFRAEGDTLTVSTFDDFEDAEPVPHVYDLRDLIEPRVREQLAEDVALYEYELAHPVSQSAGSPQAAWEPEAVRRGRHEADLAAAFSQLLESEGVSQGLTTANPAPSRFGSVRCWGGQALVDCPPDGHARIQALLRQLRAAEESRRAAPAGR